jgi:uncharacterized membrane protein
MNTKHIYLLKHILGLAIFAGILGLIRFVVTDQISYLWLNWNLFLALLPIIFAVLAVRAGNKYFIFISLILWIGFLPNAPYIITDFIHIDNVGPDSLLWFDSLMIFGYALSGLLSWVLSLSILQEKFHWKNWIVWAIALLSGFGIYLGRYIRFNTWDFLSKPLELLESIGRIILNPLEYEPVMSMTIIFTFLLAGMYFSLKPLLHNEKTNT